MNNTIDEFLGEIACLLLASVLISFHHRLRELEKRKKIRRVDFGKEKAADEV